MCHWQDVAYLFKNRLAVLISSFQPWLYQQCSLSSFFSPPKHSEKHKDDSPPLCFILFFESAFTPEARARIWARSTPKSSLISMNTSILCSGTSHKPCQSPLERVSWTNSSHLWLLLILAKQPKWHSYYPLTFTPFSLKDPSYSIFAVMSKQEALVASWFDSWLLTISGPAAQRGQLK